MKNDDHKKNVEHLGHGMYLKKCGSSVIYYPIPGDNSNGESPVGVALSRNFSCFSGIEHTATCSQYQECKVLGRGRLFPMSVSDSRRTSDYAMAYAIGTSSGCYPTLARGYRRSCVLTVYEVFNTVQYLALG